jgi:hypothetical protein
MANSKQTYRPRINHSLAERWVNVVAVANLATAVAAICTYVYSSHDEGKGGSEDSLRRRVSKQPEVGE